MSKAKEQVKPSFAPLYAAALYPQLAQVCVDNGYALAIHGSLQRDFDVVAIPWTPEAVSPRKLMNEIMKRYAVKFEHRSKHHGGRIAYTVSVGFGSCFMDFSFYPNKK